MALPLRDVGKNDPWFYESDEARSAEGGAQAGVAYVARSSRRGANRSDSTWASQVATLVSNSRGVK